MTDTEIFPREMGIEIVKSEEIRHASGTPFNSCEFQSKGDAITDLFEDMAADGAMV